MSWCSRRELCTSEIQLRLKKLEVDDTSIKKIITKLIEENFINEERFVRAYVNDKLKFQKWGIDKIKNTLYLKKISAEIIKEVISGIDKSDYILRLTEMAKQKVKYIKANSDFEREQKLLRFLASKGVSGEDAYKVLKNIKKLD
ncbi:MAG: RecX family transcriptional regulator [Bacteroidetes bacterium]|nr:RecX family transcriptional regulator [Bacteroidota bacterium]